MFLRPKVSGVFTLDRVPPDMAVIFVAIDTGLAPYVSMLRPLALRDRERRFVVLHGVRHGWDLGYRSIKDQGP